MSETKKQSSRHSNAFPECAALELSASRGGGQGERFELNADLNFGQQPLSGRDVSFRLGVKTGYLRVQLQGCAIVPETRFAVRDQPATVQRQVKKGEIESSRIEAGGSAGGKFGLGSKGVRGEAEIGGKAAGSQTTERTASYTREGTEEIHKVTFRGSSTKPSWEIGDPEAPILDGRYLGKDNLCDVIPAEENYHVMAEFGCRRRDLALTEIECLGWRPPWPPNKEKLALAVVASVLGRKAPEDLDESMLTLCRSQLASAGG